MQFTRDLIGRMPKLELHVHLESTMDPDRLTAYAARQGRLLPRSGKELYHCSAEDLSNFLAFLDSICSLVGRPEELEEIACDFSLRGRQENIVYTEAILNPTHWPQFSAEQIIGAVTRGFDRGAALGGTDCRFSLSLSRDQSAEAARSLVETMIACRTDRLAGLSIDGNEALTGRTGERFAPAFAAAKAAGFGLTVHAGESSGPEGVRDALDLLRADRLDHGVRAAEDPVLVKELARRQIPLNVCLTSNLTLLYSTAAEHPLRELWDAGVKLTFSRDDPTFLDLTLTEELARCAEFAAFSEKDLLRAQYHAIDASFCTQAEKAALRRILDRWAQER